MQIYTTALYFAIFVCTINKMFPHTIFDIIWYYAQVDCSMTCGVHELSSYEFFVGMTEFTQRVSASSQIITQER